MAGKHSKSFFDFRKNANVMPPAPQKEARMPVSLTFKIIIGLLVVSLVLSLVFVGNVFLPGIAQKKLLTDARNTFSSAQSGKTLKTLAQKNDDIKGWLKIENTQIDCAVCQSDDDTYYLNHNQLRKRSRYGALFLSASDTFERSGKDRNIVIFGNNMKDGTMFGSLKKYRDINFYKQNPCIELYYGSKCEFYVVFAVMLISSSAEDGGEIYKPSKSHFSDKNEFNEWYDETCARSLINTPISAEYGDDILTLVTVAKDFEGARLVVMAKRVDKWDAEHTDALNATINPKPKYPKIWYDNKGYKYPY